MASISGTLLYAFLGWMAGLLWTLPVGFGGAPGAFVAGQRENAKRSSWRWTVGLLLCASGQSYVALSFAAFVVLFAKSFLADADGIWKVCSWGLAFVVAMAPIMVASKDAVAATDPNVQHQAVNLTVIAAFSGFWLFVYNPAWIAWGWPWVPRII
jgi:hypothetical protein